MKKLFLFFSLVVVHITIGQTTSDSIKLEYERIYVEAGFIQPLGHLADKFEMSPSFGFWVRTKMYHEDYVDFGFNFFILKNPIKPNFKYRDSIVRYDSKYFGINIGTRFSKVISLSPKSNYLNSEWTSGIGLALNVYHAPDELHFDDGEHSEEILTTFYISQGIKLNYKNVGLQCHYQWSPYGLLNEKLEEKFGSQSLMFGIVYRQ